MYHQFDIEHAQELGIVEAILIQNLAFWIQKNKANNRSLKDGRYWTYNSAKAFSELFPYLSVHQVRRALDNLESKGVIIKANYNQAAYDRTSWYAFSDKWILRLRDFHLANLQNGNGKIATPIPDSNTDIKTDSNPMPQAKPADKLSKFNDFWKQYPKKVAKGAAEKAWQKLKLTDDLLTQILSAIEKQKKSFEWTKDNGAYIPNPATWLNQRRWEDELSNQSHPVNQKQENTQAAGYRYIGGK